MGKMWGKSADLDCEWGGMQLAGVRGCPPQTLEKVWRTFWGLPDAGQRPSPGRHAVGRGAGLPSADTGKGLESPVGTSRCRAATQPRETGF